MPRCDQTTVAGYPCHQKATWIAPDRKTREDERYCTQHANKALIWRIRGARKLDAQTN
jgi:hypothetical protein